MKAFLLGIIAIIGAWFFGKYNGSKNSKQKLETEIKILENKAEKAEKEKEIATETARTVVQKTANDVAIESYFDEFETEVKTAKEENNILAAIESAKKLAERAEGWRQRNSR